MNRIVFIAATLFFAMRMAASAQSIGSAGNVGTSLSNDIMTGGYANGVDVRVTAGSASRLAPTQDPYAARDGCINYPGQAHNSADCGRILAWDPSWVLPNKPLSEMTGAEENMVRSYNILHPHSAEPKADH
jgi:hypothetical protein